MFDRRRGSALIFVLMFAGFLAIFASAALRTGMSGAHAAIYFADTLQADELGRAVPQLVSAYVAGDSNRDRTGRFETRFAQARIEVSYLTESARIDVNHSSTALIGNLLTAAGLPAEEVQRVKAAMDQYRAASSSTPGAVVDNVPVNAEPGTQQQLQDPSDLITTFGVLSSLAGAILPALTIGNPSGRVDPTLAGRLVLLALFEGAADRTDDFITKRESGFASPESVLLLVPEKSKSYIGFEPSPTLRAAARVTVQTGLQRSYDIVLTPALRSSDRLLVHAWRQVY